MPEDFAEALLREIASDLKRIPDSWRGEARGASLEVEDPRTGRRYRVAVVAVGPAPGAIRRYERCWACRGRDERCATCGGDGYVPLGDYRRGRSGED